MFWTSVLVELRYEKVRRNKLLNEFTPIGLVILSAIAVVVIGVIVIIILVVFYNDY